MTTPEPYYVKSDSLKLDMQQTAPAILSQIECLLYFRAPAAFINKNKILLSLQIATIRGCHLSR